MSKIYVHDKSIKRRFEALKLEYEQRTGLGTNNSEFLEQLIACYEKIVFGENQ